MIQNAPTVDGMELMADKFFEPRPITDAKAYYLHTVLHDWDDENVLAIFERLASVMDSGALDDMAVPDIGAYWWLASLNLHKLAVLGAHERTESQ